jgi:hypothetical protein
MPYGLVLVAVSVGFAIWYVIATDASRKSKYLIAGCVAVSLVVPRLLPVASVIAMALQIGVSVFLILYWKATSDVP